MFRFGFDIPRFGFAQRPLLISLRTGLRPIVSFFRPTKNKPRGH